MINEIYSLINLYTGRGLSKTLPSRHDLVSKNDIIASFKAMQKYIIGIGLDLPYDKKFRLTAFSKGIATATDINQMAAHVIAESGTLMTCLCGTCPQGTQVDFNHLSACDGHFGRYIIFIESFIKSLSGNSFAGTCKKMYRELKLKENDEFPDFLLEAILSRLLR